MKKLFVFVLMAMLLVSMVAATTGNNNNGNNNDRRPWLNVFHMFDNHNNNGNNGNNNNDNNNGKPGDNKDCDNKWFCNQGLTFECQNFYNNSRYYTIAKWSYDDHKYILEEQNSMYRYYKTNVKGNLKVANWTSNPEVQSVLVKAGNNEVEFAGGTSGLVNSTKDISHITLCGFKADNGGCTGSNCGGGSNGVPEFPAFALGAAVLAVTLGLVFLRKN